MATIEIGAQGERRIVSDAELLSIYRAAGAERQKHSGTNHSGAEDERRQGMADTYDQLRALDEPRRDWTAEIRSHREAQEQDKAAGNLGSWTYHEGIVTVLAEHCTCRAHRALYGVPV